MGHIFISYSHKDKEYVQKFHDALQNRGFHAWMDDRIDFGDEWLKVIQKHLDESDIFIVIMSRNSFESDMVQNEIARAREKRKTIFPLLLDGENWLIVQAKQYVDVTDGSFPKEKFYRDLASAMSLTPNQLPVSSNRRNGKRRLLWILFLTILAFGGVLAFVLTRPTFSKLNAFSSDSKPIDKDHAPYHVLISGNVAHAKGYYLYFIVNDGHKQWIQKPYGKISDDDLSFSGDCYLGAGEDDPDAKNKTFTIYAVVSDKGSYIEYGDFTDQPVIARSEAISLIRQDFPEP